MAVRDEEFYNLDGVICTGDHNIKYNNIWIKVKNHKDSNKIENKNTTIVQKVKKKNVKEIKNLLKSENFQNWEINEPGNRTYFIRVFQNQNEKSVRWNDTTENDKVKNLYKKLLETIINKVVSLSSFFKVSET